MEVHGPEPEHHRDAQRRGLRSLRVSGVDAILVKMEADLARIAATGDASLAALTQGHTTAAAAVRLG